MFFVYTINEDTMLKNFDIVNKRGIRDDAGKITNEVGDRRKAIYRDVLSFSWTFNGTN
jgi:hypothetical protein